jgi:hypothetical protein
VYLGQLILGQAQGLAGILEEVRRDGGLLFLAVGWASPGISPAASSCLMT